MIFFFEYINQLNKFCGGEDLISEKNLNNNCFSLGDKVYLNIYAYKNIIINFNELFKFLSVNELNKVSLLLKKQNLIYLKECKIKYLDKKFNNILSNKYNTIDNKKDIFYNEEIASFNKKIKVLDEKQINNIYNGICKQLKYKKNNFIESNKKQLEGEIKKNIKFEFKEQYLSNLNNFLNNNYPEIKDINTIIALTINFIKDKKKDEYFINELYYYLTKQQLQYSIMARKKENNALEYIANYNKQVPKKEEIKEEELENLDVYLFELDFVINKLEGFINDIQ